MCISSPSDALDALSIGATDEFGVYAFFSSYGIINGNYVKPNIAAQGENCYVAYPDSTFNYGSGTSFSSPINAGMMACLWQSWPDIDQLHLRLAIQQSANQYTHPDTLLGYGVPDYSKANLILSTGSLAMPNNIAYPNPFSEAFALSLDSHMSGKIELTLYSVAGETLLSREIYKPAGMSRSITVGNLSSLAPGMYILKISDGNQTDYLHVVKAAK